MTDSNVTLASLFILSSMSSVKQIIDQLPMLVGFVDFEQVQITNTTTPLVDGSVLYEFDVFFNNKIRTIALKLANLKLANRTFYYNHNRALTKGYYDKDAQRIVKPLVEA